MADKLSPITLAAAKGAGGGGGGGTKLPDYSTTEQKTGRKWLDGKDEYVITVRGTYGKYSTVLLNVSTFIGIMGYEVHSDNRRYGINGNMFMLQTDSTSLQTVYEQDTYISATIFYTKSNES